jgi:hypothetical protein
MAAIPVVPLQLGGMQHDHPWTGGNPANVNRNATLNLEPRTLFPNFIVSVILTQGPNLREARRFDGRNHTRQREAPRLLQRSIHVTWMAIFAYVTFPFL